MKLFRSRPFWWGILLALADLGLYFRYLDPLSLDATFHVVLIGVTLFAGATGFAFVLISCFRWALERKRGDAWRGFTAFSHGALAGACLLITIFSRGSNLNILFLPPSGGLTSNFWALTASAVVLGLVWGVTVFKRPLWEQASRLSLLVWLGAVAAWFTYTSAHGPQSHFHALLVVTVICLAGWPANPVRLERTLLTTLAVAAVLVGAGFTLDATAKNNIRLIVHERSRMTFQIAARSPATPPRFPQCDSVKSLEARPSTHEINEFHGSQPKPVRGVVFVILDTVRADVIEGHHKGSPIAPNLTQFLENSVSYQRAYTVHPYTSGSMRTLYDESFRSSINEELSLLDVFSALPHYVVIPSHAYLLRHAGEPQIIDLNADQGGNILKDIDLNLSPDSAQGAFRLTSDKITDAALQQFESLPKDDQFALLVHYFDPHAPYVPNDLFEFGSSDRARYEASIAYTDYWLGKLLAGLEKLGRDDVAVVIISDHGEEFGDHGYFYHSYSLYDESTRIVMGIDLPSHNEGLSVEQLVALPALGPTLAALVGSDIRSPEHHLLPPWGAPADVVPLGSRASFGSVQGEWKVIFNKRTGVRELYHLEEDPREQRNVADDHPELFERLICRATDTFPNILKP